MQRKGEVATVHTAARIEEGSGAEAAAARTGGENRRCARGRVEAGRLRACRAVEEVRAGHCKGVEGFRAARAPVAARNFGSGGVHLRRRLGEIPALAWLNSWDRKLGEILGAEA